MGIHFSSILFLSFRTSTATYIFNTMSLFYASPSEDNLNVCESTSPAYGLDTADSSVGFLEGNHTQSPTERIRIIRKRMRSGKHKYSVRKPESTVGVDATARAFAQSLKVNEIFSHDDDRAAADDNTATTNTVHDREAMATPPPAKRAAIEGMDQHFSTYKPGELSPLPTPGRNHAAARSYHSSLDNPPFLPMGDRQGLEVPCLGHRSLTTDDMPSVTARSPKVPSSLLDNYPQQANASYMYRIRPNFASVWLRDLVNEKAERSKQDPRSWQCKHPRATLCPSSLPTITTDRASCSTGASPTGGRGWLSTKGSGRHGRRTFTTHDGLFRKGQCSLIDTVIRLIVQ